MHRFVAGRWRAALLPAIAGLCFACDSTGPGEDFRPLKVDEPAAGQTTSAGDTVTYLASVQAGDSVRLFLQGTSGSAQDALVADLYHQSVGVLGSVSSTGAAPALDSRGTAWVAVPAGRLLVRVHRVSGAEKAPFRLLLVRRNAAPESVPAQVELGQVVAGERFEHEGDVDEFRFSAAAGAEVIVFLRPTGGAPFRVQAVLAPPGGEPAGALKTFEGAPASLEESSSGRLRLAAAGEYRLRLTAGGATDGQPVPYEFRVYSVNRAPEQGPAHLAVGDTAVQALEDVGDVDEYTFDLAAGQQVNVSFQAVDAVQAGIRMEASPPTGLPYAVLHTTSRQESLDELAIGTTVLFNPGRYTLRVLGVDQGRRADATGRYRLNVYAIDPRPESVPAVLAPGQTQSAERIDRLGDVDEFTLSAPAATLTNLVLRAQGTPGQWISAYTAAGPSAQARAGTADEEGGSGTLTLAPERPVKVTVRTGSGATGSYLGAYTIRLPAFTAAPESRGAAIATGVWVEGEAVHPAGDIDVFHFQGVRGQVVTLTAQPNEASTRAVGVSVADPQTMAYTRLGTAWLPDFPSAGRIVLPRDGRFDVWVSSVNGGRMMAEAGGYRFRVDVLDTGPEHAPAALARGDSVAERMDQPGDIDDFIVTAPAGSTLKVNGMWMVKGSTQFGGQVVAVDLLNASTGALLGGGGLYDDGPLWSPLEAVVPADGRVRVRVYERGTEHFAVAGPYWLKILP